MNSKLQNDVIGGILFLLGFICIPIGMGMLWGWGAGILAFGLLCYISAAFGGN